jgi:hypothetical protein
MAETMTSLEIAYIEGLCETDGEGTVSLAEEDFERICEQAKRVPDLSTRLLAAERDAARYRWLRDESPKHCIPAPSATLLDGQGIKVKLQSYGVDERYKPTLLLSGAALDAAVDAARSEREAG